ncbi:hypothetical protein [Tateyamaria sp.]|uniref:hypothetical protein n=1 Tax=Tateyamaria sp. TaxID=1929288 RepID=UPI003B2111E0
MRQIKGSTLYRLNSAEVQQAVLQGHRAAQINWMLEQGDRLEDFRAAHATLFSLTPERRARLEAFDLMREVPFDPSGMVDAAALSPSAFDTDLIRRNPWISDVLDLSSLG